MPGQREFHFRSMPSLWTSYARAFTSRKPKNVPEGQQPAPRLEATLHGVRVRKGPLARYRKVCGCSSSHALPIAFPHAMAMPLQMAILTCPVFPVQIAGLVHVRGSITQQQPLTSDVKASLRTWIEGHRETDHGQEFDAHTEVHVGADVLWSEVSTYLAWQRRKRVKGQPRGPKAERVPDHAPPENSRVTSIVAPSGLGRRYAFAAGDYNPIHLSDFTARPFGFEHAIVQGMWSMARCAAELMPSRLQSPARLDVQFRSPVRLPSELQVHRWDLPNGEAFSLRSEGHDRSHLTGTLISL